MRSFLEIISVLMVLLWGCGCGSGDRPEPAPGPPGKSEAPESAEERQARSDREAEAKRLLALAGTPVEEARAKPPAKLPDLQQQASRILALSPAALRALVPDQCPGIKPACPVDKAFTDWTWNPERPHEVACTKCATVFPNPRFPMDREAVFLNLQGTEIRIPYHQGPWPTGDARGNKHPDRYFFGGAVDNGRYQWLLRELSTLDALYRTGGEATVARSMAVLLDALADKAPQYLLHGGRGVNSYYVSSGGPWMRDGKPKGKAGTDLPYAWTDGRLGTWWASELDGTLLRAYESVLEAGVLQDDEGKRIEDFFRGAVDFIMRVPWKYHLGNNLGDYFANIATLGKLMGEPAYLHIAYEYLQRVFLEYGRFGAGVGYAMDLHNAEGTQAHYGVMSRAFQVYESIEGWSDPPGYRGKNGLHLEKVSLKKDLPLFGRSLYVPETYTFPNGAKNALQETIAYGKTGTRAAPHLFFHPLKESRNRLLPGFGHAVLGDGAGKRQAQVQLHFSDDRANRAHLDRLSLTWFAHGKELSGEIGYQRNALRQWSASTLSHNTVLVDGVEQARSAPGIGRVLLYSEGLPGLAALQVEAEQVYQEQGVSRYRRTVVHNTRDLDHPYFIDLFEVHGGRVHDYTLHGSVDGDMVGAARASGIRASEADMAAVNRSHNMPERVRGGAPYKLISGLQHADGERPYAADFAYREGGGGTRIHVLPQSGQRIYLGSSPALGKAGQGNDEDVMRWRMPHLVLRTRGEARSLFVTVCEPYGSEPPEIRSIRRIEAGDEVLALEIITARRRDLLLLSLDGARKMAAGGVSMHGRLGFVSQAGEAADRYLVQGTRIEAGGRSLEVVVPEYAGTISAARRKADGEEADALISSASLPDDGSLDGQWMMLSYGEQQKDRHAFPIDRIERRGTETWIHLDLDHGLRIGEFGERTEQVFSPFEEYVGLNRFVIHTEQASVACPRIVPATGPWDPVVMQRHLPFMRSVLARIEGPPGATLRYSLDGSDPGPDAPVYVAPLRITETTELRAVVDNPGGIMPPRVVKQHFRRAAAPQAVQGLPPGLRYLQVVRGKPQPVRNLRRFDQVHREGDQIIYVGYLVVPEDGLYTLSAQAHNGCNVYVDDFITVWSSGLGPYQRFEGSIALQAGAHPIKIVERGPFGASPRPLSLRISGPGLPEQPVDPGMLLRD